MATITAQANGVGATNNWTLSAGASKAAAVNSPDDDATSYISSGTTSGTYQYFTCSPALSTGDEITQIKLYCRARRGGASDCDFRIGYTFTPDGGGTQTNESGVGVLTGTASYADYTYTDSGLSVDWGSGLQFWVRNTQARNLYVTTFYVEITYNPAPSLQTLIAPHIASTLSIHAPVVVPPDTTLVAPHIASTLALHEPAVAVGAVALAMPVIASTLALYEPTVTTGGVTLIAPVIASTLALYEPTVTLAPLNLTVPHIASTLSIHAPDNVFLPLGLVMPHIASTLALSAGMVHRGSIKIVNITTYANDDITSATFDHETPAGDDRLLVVIAAYYDSVGVTSLVFGESGTGNGQFNYAYAIARAPDGTLYVTDSTNQRVQYFDADGTYAGQWGSSGSGDGEFTGPRGIALDSAGNVYVVDTGNQRVQKFTAAGVYVTQWGSSGSGDGEFEEPTGIAIDGDDNIYVSDAALPRVQVFDSDGTYLAQWGASGTDDGQIDEGGAIAVSPDGYIYLCDRSTDVVQVFTPAGEFVRRFALNKAADSIAVTDDAFYIILGSTIEKRSLTGALLDRFGGRGTAVGQLDTFTQLTVDDDGNVYVADNANDRVQVFPPDQRLTVPSYNDVEMTAGAGVDAGSFFQTVYTLPAPPVGTYPLSFVGPTAPDAFMIVVISLTGVDTATTEYDDHDASRAFIPSSTTALYAGDNRAYPTNTLSLWALLYETAGTTLTPETGNYVLFSHTVGELTQTIGQKATATATTGSQTFGATASPAVTPKVFTLIHIEAARGPIAPPVIELLTLHEPSVSIGQQLLGAHIASTATVHDPEQVALVLAAPLIASTLALHAPAVRQVLAMPVITLTTLHAPTIAAGNIALAMPVIALTTLHEPAIVTGSVTLTAPHIALSPAAHEPAVVVGAVFLRVPVLASYIVPHAPRLAATYGLAAPYIASTLALHAPTATNRSYIVLPHLGLGQPNAANAPVILNPVTLYAMTLSMRLAMPVIALMTIHTPDAVAVGTDLRSGKVHPPIEVDNV